MMVLTREPHTSCTPAVLICHKATVHLVHANNMQGMKNYYACYYLAMLLKKKILFCSSSIVHLVPELEAARLPSV